VRRAPCIVSVIFSKDIGFWRKTILPFLISAKLAFDFAESRRSEDGAC
jgi:hypothetical protein